MPLVPSDPGAAALARLAGSPAAGGEATRDILEARAWLLILARADVAVSVPPADLVKAIFAEHVTLVDALEARALESATEGAAVSKRDTQGLTKTIWPGGEPAKDIERLYDLASSARSDDARGGGALLGRETRDAGVEGARRLLDVVADRVAEAAAWLPRAEIDRVPARAPDTLSPRLDHAERLLEVALRRDPLSPRAHRARAELALTRAELDATLDTEPDRVHEHVPSARRAAAVAALLDPFDRRNVELIVCVALASGEKDLAHLWAVRMHGDVRGTLSSVESALVEAETTPGGPDQHAEALEQLARLAAVGGAADEARSLLATAGQLDAQALQRIEELERDRPPPDEGASRPARAHAPFPYAPLSVVLRRRLAEVRYTKGDPLSWAELALTWEPGIDLGVRDVARPAGENFPADPDPVATLGNVIQLVRRIEGERDRKLAEATLVKVKSLLAEVFVARPRAVATRVVMDYALALGGTPVEAAEALSDAERLQNVLDARADAGAWNGARGPALLAAAREVARARLDPAARLSISIADPGVALILDRDEARPSRERLGLRFKTK